MRPARRRRPGWANDWRKIRRRSATTPSRAWASATSSRRHPPDGSKWGKAVGRGSWSGGRTRRRLGVSRWGSRTSRVSSRGVRSRRRLKPSNPRPSRTITRRRSTSAATAGRGSQTRLARRGRSPISAWASAWARAG